MRGPRAGVARVAAAAAAATLSSCVAAAALNMMLVWFWCVALWAARVLAVRGSKNVWRFGRRCVACSRPPQFLASRDLAARKKKKKNLHFPVPKSFHRTSDLTSPATFLRASRRQHIVRVTREKQVPRTCRSRWPARPRASASKRN